MCPTGKHGPDDRCLCAGIWWHDIDGGEQFGESNEVKVVQPSFTYTAHRRPDGVAPDYSPGFFASLPIGRIAVIRDEGGAHFEGLKAAKASSLSVALVSE